MRIAVSGTHFVGKSTLIEDFIKNHPNYRCEKEAYYKLEEEKTMELALEPSLESVIEQLDYSLKQLSDCAKEENIIFDRCPVDYLAYALCAIEEDEIDIYDTEIEERFSEIKNELNHLDLIVFIPMTKEDPIEYTEDNPNYRKKADKYFKKIYRDQIYDIFPKYNHPKIVEITGDRITRIKKLENYLADVF